MAIFSSKGDHAHNPEAVTLVGEEAYFHGVLAAKGSLRIEGVVEGDITDAVNVDIGKKGRVKGNVAAEALSLAGVLEGDVVCSRAVEVLAGGRLAGSIRTPKLRIEEGAMFDGSCAMVATEETAPRLATEGKSYQPAERS
mgnify:CR=1 FL=1